MLSTNTTVEWTFSNINISWQDEKSRFLRDTIKAIFFFFFMLQPFRPNIQTNLSPAFLVSTSLRQSVFGWKPITSPFIQSFQRSVAFRTIFSLLGSPVTLLSPYFLSYIFQTYPAHSNFFHFNFGNYIWSRYPSYILCLLCHSAVRWSKHGPYIMRLQTFLSYLDILIFLRAILT